MVARDATRREGIEVVPQNREENRGLEEEAIERERENNDHNYYDDDDDEYDGGHDSGD